MRVSHGSLLLPSSLPSSRSRSPARSLVCVSQLESAAAAAAVAVGLQFGDSFVLAWPHAGLLSHAPRAHLGHVNDTPSVAVADEMSLAAIASRTGNGVDKDIQEGSDPGDYGVAPALPRDSE